jgi:hypothetical protein
MGTSGSLINTQLPLPEDPGTGIETPKYSCSGHEDSRLIDKYRPAIRRTPCFRSGTQEAQLLAGRITPTPDDGKVIERRTLNIAYELRSNHRILTVLSKSFRSIKGKITRHQQLQ